jgi:hypothetical protein
MDLRRRKIIKWSLLSSAGILLGHSFLLKNSYTYDGWFTSVNSKSKELLMGLPYDIKLEVAQSFVLDYMKYRGVNTTFEITEKVRQQFLLSTSIIFVLMQKSKDIKYVLYYDPYIHPCYNPYTQYAHALKNK